MATHIKNVIVAGSTGNLGPYILRALQSSEFTVSILKRTGSSTSSSPSDVTAHETDYSPDSLASILRSQDAVINLLPVTAIDAQLALVEAAAKAGVKRFIPSEFGWNPDRPTLEELKSRLSGKTKVIDKLREVCGSRESTMSWTAIVSGVFLNWSLTKVPILGFVISAHKARIYDSGDEPITGSTGEDMGAAVVNVLLAADQTANGFVKIRSATFTQNTLLKAVEKITHAPWQVERISTADVAADRARKVQEGRFQEAFMDTLVLQLLVDGAGRGVVVGKEECDNELLGIKEKDIETVARSIIA